MKFRIWDKLEKKMIYPEDFGARHFTISLKGEVFNLQNGAGGSNDYLPLQLLETHPKLGDIYHGDIIKVENLSEWWDVEPLAEEHKYSHVVVKDVKTYNYHYQFRHAVDKVGNVFENPEVVDMIRENYRKITAGREIDEDLLSLTWD